MESTPVKIVTWRDLAERCAHELKKGDLVAIDGRLQINNYATSEGQKRKDVEIDASNVENLSSTLSKIERLQEDYLDSGVSEVAAQPRAKVGRAPASEDLDAIFASEDEIPF
jgi:single stranded DNA-binding protein